MKIVDPLRPLALEMILARDVAAIFIDIDNHPSTRLAVEIETPGQVRLGMEVCLDDLAIGMFLPDGVIGKLK